MDGWFESRPRWAAASRVVVVETGVRVGRCCRRDGWIAAQRGWWYSRD